MRDHAAVRIELRIDDSDILGMVTLFDEEERVVFSDIPDIGDRLASHRRTGEGTVHIDYGISIKAAIKVFIATFVLSRRGNGATDAPASTG